MVRKQRLTATVTTITDGFLSGVRERKRRTAATEYGPGKRQGHDELQQVASVITPGEMRNYCHVFELLGFASE